MKNLTICLPNGTFDGIVHMDSSRSAFSAIRIPRSDLLFYRKELSQIGLYMFLIGNDDVYVGQSGQPLFERISNTHTGSIDSDWDTVVAFPCKNRLSDNELRFIENALCEYAHKHCPRCITSSPSKGNCSAKYRKEHYKLMPMEIDACNEYVEDIEFYISHLQDSNFSLTDSTILISKPTANKNDAQYIVTESPIVSTTSEMMLFSWHKNRESTGGVAQIELFPASNNARRIILKKGTQLSSSISSPEHFRAHAAVKQLRKQYEDEGIIRDYILLQDIELPPGSSSFALEFIAGNSHSGNRDWRTIDEPHLTLGEIEQRVK